MLQNRHKLINAPWHRSQSKWFAIASALCSSIIETVMLVLYIAWAVIFSATLLHPGNSSLEGRASVVNEQLVERQA